MITKTYQWTREQGDWKAARRAMQQTGASIEADFDSYIMDSGDTAKLTGSTAAAPLGALENDDGAPRRALKSLIVTWEEKA